MCFASSSYIKRSKAPFILQDPGGQPGLAVATFSSAKSSSQSCSLVLRLGVPLGRMPRPATWGVTLQCKESYQNANSPCLSLLAQPETCARCSSNKDQSARQRQIDGQDSKVRQTFIYIQIHKPLSYTPLRISQSNLIKIIEFMHQSSNTNQIHAVTSDQQTGSQDNMPWILNELLSISQNDVQFDFLES